MDVLSVVSPFILISSLSAGPWGIGCPEKVDISEAEYIFNFQRALECQRTSDYDVSKY